MTWLQDLRGEGWHSRFKLVGSQCAAGSSFFVPLGAVDKWPGALALSIAGTGSMQVMVYASLNWNYSTNTGGPFYEVSSPLTGVGLYHFNEIIPPVARFDINSGSAVDVYLGR